MIRILCVSLRRLGLAYVMQRYREVHDFWHVICALPTSVAGEVALK